MTEVTKEEIVLNKHHLLRGVLVALIALLVGGAVFAAGEDFGRFHGVTPANAFRMARFGGHRFAPRPQSFRQATDGTVKSIGSASLTLTGNGGDTLTASLSDSTVILDHGSVVALSDLKVGDEVSVIGTVHGTTIQATRIIVNPASRVGHGTF